MPAHDIAFSEAEVYEELARRGATRAVIEYSGGHDEGGADSITLYNGDAEIGSVDETWGEPSAQEATDNALAEALCEPIYARFGGFASENEVSGTLEWIVAERQWHGQGSCTDWVADPSWDS